MTESQNSKQENVGKLLSSYELKDKIDNLKEPDIVVKSNMPTLDKLTGGFVPGELIVISGPTKNGKTLFAQTLTVEFDRQAFYPLWFSYEVAPKYFLRVFDKLPLFYVPDPLKQNDLRWALSKMIECQQQFKTRVVFIDHLHYLFDISKANSPSLEIGVVIRYLKNLAVKRGLIIFLLCHTTKVDLEERMTLKSIRDSSFVSQESDTVLLIQRDTKEPDSNLAQITVEVCRRTGVLHEPVPLIKVGRYLKEFEEEEDYE